VKRFLVMLFLLIAAFLLQCTLCRSILAFSGIAPNIILVFIVSFALVHGDMTGLLLGFFSGIMLDLVFGDMIGLYALIYMFVGFVFGKFYESYSPEKLLPSISLIALSNLILGLVCYIFLFMLRSRLHFEFYLLHIILPEVIYTTVISLILYPAFYFINEALTADEQRRARKFV
jgi:rod shape-determining protein MreD